MHWSHQYIRKHSWGVYLCFSAITVAYNTQLNRIVECSMWFFQCKRKVVRASLLPTIIRWRPDENSIIILFLSVILPFYKVEPSTILNVYGTTSNMSRTINVSAELGMECHYFGCYEKSITGDETQLYYTFTTATCNWAPSSGSKFEQSVLHLLLHSYWLRNERESGMILIPSLK